MEIFILIQIWKGNPKTFIIPFEINVYDNLSRLHQNPVLRIKKVASRPPSDCDWLVRTMQQVCNRCFASHDRRRAGAKGAPGGERRDNRLVVCGRFLLVWSRKADNRSGGFNKILICCCCWYCGKCCVLRG